MNILIIVCKFISLLVMLFSLTSCNDNNFSSIGNKSINNIFNNSSKSYNSRYLFIKDISKYDKAFIDGLIKYSRDQKQYLVLIDDILTVQNENYSLSSDIESNKIYVFERNEENKIFLLHLMKYNYSSLEFALKIIIDGKIIREKSGLVTLNPCFFLGAESDDDEETGSSFFVTTYRHEESIDYVYISVGENDNGLLQARVEFNGFSKLPILYLDRAMNKIAN